MTIGDRDWRLFLKTILIVLHMTTALSSSGNSILWITGYPGCGKTTVGDYLAKYAGYVHVDVDDEFMFPRFIDGKPNPEDTILSAYLQSWSDFFAGRVPANEDFGPFLDLVCDRILSLRNEQQLDGGAKIVVTQGMHREGRDFVRKLVPEIFFIGLAASLEKKIERNRIKMERFYPLSTGRSHQEVFEERTGLKYTAQNFAKDWRETNAARIPKMDKMDVETDEEQEGQGCNISVDAVGDAGVLLEVRKICGIEPAGKEEDINTVVQKSWAKMEKHFKKK